MPTLPRPGVEVVQTIRTTSPTITAPQLVPCVVGPNFDIVEATVVSAVGVTSNNANSTLVTPATIVGTAASASFAVGGSILSLRVNNGAIQTHTFSGALAAAFTPQALLNEFIANFTGVTPTLSNTGATPQIQFLTVATGAASVLEIDPDGTSTAGLLLAIGLTSGDIATGKSNYSNTEIIARSLSFPVNHGVIAERVIDTTTIRSFIRVSGVLQELEDDSTVNRNHQMAGATNLDVQSHTAAAEDDLDGDGTTAYVRINPLQASVVLGQDATQHGFTITALRTGNANGVFGNVVSHRIVANAGAAALVITYGGTGVGQVFNGAALITYTFGIATLATWGALMAAINLDATWSQHFLATLPTGFTGTGATIATAEGNLMVAAGLAMTGGADPRNLAAVGSAPIMTSSLISVGSTPVVTGLNLQLRRDGGETYTANFTDDTFVNVKAAIDGLLGLGIIAIDADGGANSQLSLTHSAAPPFGATTLGHEGTIEVLGGTAVDALFGAQTTSVQASAAFVTGTANKHFIITCVNNDRVGGFNGMFDGTGIDIIFDCRVGGGGVFSVTYVGGLDAPSAVTIRCDEDHATILNYAQMVTALNNNCDFASNFVASLGGDGLGLPVDADAGGGGDTVAMSGGDWRVDALTNQPIGPLANGGAGKMHGNPHPAVVGDGFYSGGVRVGRIAAINNLTQGSAGSAGVNTYTNARIDLDGEVVTTAAYATWYIKALELIATDADTADLVIDTTGGNVGITLKHNAHRDAGGVPVAAAADTAYLQYTALRTDTTADATNPSLTRHSGTTALDAAIGPINQNNPLALGMYLSLLNAPTIEVTGLGVGATSVASPDGTAAAYSTALDYLEAQEVYAIAPLTQDAIVHQATSTHVTAMSGVDNKRERIAFVNAAEPDREADEIVASGLDGEGTGVANQFSVPLYEANLLQESTDLITPAMADPANPTAAEGVFLDISSDNARYSVSTISANNTLTVRTVFAAGENDDNFYATTAIDTTLLNEDWSLKRRGAAITTNTDIVDAMAAIATAYGSRRLFWVQPETVVTTIEGLEQEVGGQYACAAITGMVGQQNPSQPFTNFPMVGFSGVEGSNTKFSTTQLDTAAGGGVYWLIQDVDGAPIIARHQLSTNITTVETRELSIVKAVDYTAKFMRTSLKRFIGRYVINASLMQLIGAVAKGVIEVLREANVIAGGEVQAVVQDTDNPDRVMVDVVLNVLYPCNYIRVTLII